MEYNWTAIKRELKRDLADIFANGTPSYDIEEGLDLFEKLIYADVHKASLGGLTRTLPEILHELYDSKIGEIGPLKLLADSLEPILKKIAIIINNDNPANILGKTLMPLIKSLNLNQALTTQTNSGYPQLSATTISSFRGEPEYLEFICDSYITRNEVHQAPDYNRRMVLEKAASILVVIFYAVLKYKNQIAALPEIRPHDENLVNKISGEQQYLYDFISFGNSTYKVRTQIVTSFILSFIKKTVITNIKKIEEASNLFFQDQLGTKFYLNITSNLNQNNRIIIDKETKSITLTAQEALRLDQIHIEFDKSRNIFFKLLEDVAEEFSIGDKVNELFDQLQEFTQNNYKIDFAEAESKGELIDTDQNDAYHNFYAFLQGILPDKSKVNSLFQNLTILSKESDFLIKMCASKAFANLTNPDRFEQYIRQQEKVVYLDTQIILHALCLNYLDPGEYSNVYYSTIEELMDISSRNKNIKLKVSKLYLQEAIYQLRLAILLIPFERYTDAKLSSNVFYLFYWHMKRSNLLVAEDETFGRFMNNWFLLREDDAYDSKFTGIAFGTVKKILDNLGIEIETLPNYDDNKGDAIEVIQEVLINENVKLRPKNSVSNDALMMMHLCNIDIHQMEPFFLTWDRMFTKFRKSYLRKYKRGELLSFHLLSPARFINHFSLIKLKINPSAITNDFLSLIETDNIHDNTQTIWDAMNRFLNIDNIKANQKNRYIQRMKELLEKEFDYSIEEQDDSVKATHVIISLEDILSKIDDHYANHSKISIQNYRRMILEDSFFERVTNLILKNIVNPQIEEVLLPELDLMVHEFNTPK